MILNLIASDMIKARSKYKIYFFSTILLFSLNLLCILLFNVFYESQIALSSTNKLVSYNYTIIYNQYTFNILILLLSFILSIIVNIIFILHYLEKRTRDIAIMKTAGVNFNDLYQFFTLPLLILHGIGILISCILIWILGGIFGLLVSTSNTISNILLVLMFPASFLIVVLTSSYKINKLFKKRIKTMENGNFDLENLEARKPSLSSRIYKKISKSLLFAYRNLKIRKREFSRSFLILTISLTVLGILFTGIFVIQSTYKQQLRDALGGKDYSDVYLIAHEDIGGYLKNTYDRFYNPSVDMVDIGNFTDASFMMNATKINFSAWSDYFNVIDKRVVYHDVVREIKGYTPAGGGGNYQEWGEERQTEAIIFGVQFNSVFNKWKDLNIDQLTTETTPLVIGDSIAGIIFENIEYQDIGILEKEYDISARIFEPFNNGFCLYMDSVEIANLLGISMDMVNCVFISLNNDGVINREVIIEQINEELYVKLGEDYSIQSLEIQFTAILNSTNEILFIHLILILIMLFFSFVYQLEFINLNIDFNFNDYRTMYKLGITRGQISKIVSSEFLLVLIDSILLSFGISLIFNTFFLIPDPNLPSILVPILIFGLIISGLLALNIIITKIKLNKKI